MCILGEAEALGFETHNHKNICGHVELKGESDDYIGVVGHMDVVPEEIPRIGFIRRTVPRFTTARCSAEERSTTRDRWLRHSML